MSAVLLLISLLATGTDLAQASADRVRHPRRDEGVRFSCPPDEIPEIRVAMAAYLQTLGIPADFVLATERPAQGVLVYTLATPTDDVSTLDLAGRPELAIATEQVTLQIDAARSLPTSTVSKKEIMLALLQHGRLTELRGTDCSVDVLSRHVTLRQSIVAWAERLRWGWPEGGPAKWNPTYWDRGTPRPEVSLLEAIGDVFANQEAYTIGCYTAAKLVMVKGFLDFYEHADDLPGMSAWVQARLLSDREPLLDVEPPIAWSFEPDFDPREASRPGKLMSIIRNVAPKNFVPGDWTYFINTDPVSSQRTGYEGANAIYLGGGRFNDYYGENNHAFSYWEKLDAVFQWRNGLFNRQRDAWKRRPLTINALDRLGRSPTRGGLVFPWRMTPDFFGTVTRKSLRRDLGEPLGQRVLPKDSVVGLGEAAPMPVP